MRGLVGAFIGSLMCFGANAFAFDQSHKLWADVLTQFVVSEGPSTLVRYQALLKDRSHLDAYVKEVSSVNLKDYNSWNEPTRLAFLFNAYNALTVQFIVDGLANKPGLKSIKDLGGVFSSPWKKQFFNFLGESSNLDHIEQDLARPKFDEPRMHMAFNCASLGCPALSTKPFLGETLDAQLEQAAIQFLQDPRKNNFESKKKELHLSSIFKWYGEDFENSKKFGPLNTFIAKRISAEESDRKLISAGQVTVDFKDYDWNLNIKK